MKYAYICYAGGNEYEASDLSRSLKLYGFKSVPEYSDDFYIRTRFNVNADIEKCHLFIVLLSESAKEDYNVLRELSFAQICNKKILVITIRDRYKTSDCEINGSIEKFLTPGSYEKISHSEVCYNTEKAQKLIKDMFSNENTSEIVTPKNKPEVSANKNKGYVYFWRSNNSDEAYKIREWFEKHEISVKPEKNSAIRTDAEEKAAVEGCSHLVILFSGKENFYFSESIAEVASKLNKPVTAVLLDDNSPFVNGTFYVSENNFIRSRVINCSLFWENPEAVEDYFKNGTPLNIPKVEEKTKTVNSENTTAVGKPYSGDRPFIFVSYSHKNTDEVLSVICQLQSLGYRVWYDEGIDPGTEWDENIAAHVNSCGMMLAFVTDDYIKSENCKDELNYARDLNISRVLIYLKPTELPFGMAMRLNRIQAVHKYKYNDEKDFYDKLLSIPDIDKYK